MSVGLPGTGVGSAFYLIAALWAPVRERLAGADADRRRRARRIAALALAILLAIVAASYAVSLLVPQAVVTVVSVAADEDGAGGMSLRVPLVLLLLSPLGTLVVVMALVRLARLLTPDPGNQATELAARIVVARQAPAAVAPRAFGSVALGTESPHPHTGEAD